jgi:hypothetical protein
LWKIRCEKKTRNQHEVKRRRNSPGRLVLPTTEGDDHPTNDRPGYLKILGYQPTTTSPSNEDLLKTGD